MSDAKLRGPFLEASQALEEIWKLRWETGPSSETGIVVQQCKALQLQLMAVILANGWDRSDI